jgi:uncharacterized protein (DUF342 family)
MPTSIAAYYTDELSQWNEAIDFYREEMLEMERNLAAVIERNSVPGLAAQVEVHQTKLEQVTDKFYHLQLEIQQQETLLKTDNLLVEDEHMNTDLENKQTQLRQEMEKTEKEYVNIKFDCYHFLSGIFKK